MVSARSRTPSVPERGRFRLKAIVRPVCSSIRRTSARSVSANKMDSRSPRCKVTGNASLRARIGWNTLRLREAQPRLAEAATRPKRPPQKVGAATALGNGRRAARTPPCATGLWRTLTGAAFLGSAGGKATPTTAGRASTLYRAG